MSNSEIKLHEITKIKANWDEIILSHIIKENLDFSIVWPAENLGKPRDFGTILFGLPGVGKTTIPFAIAKKLGWRLFYIGPKDFVTKDRNVELGIKEIFEKIEKKYLPIKRAWEKYDELVEKGVKPDTKPKSANMVFVFDEIDEFVASRDPTTDKDSRLLTTMMLPLFNDLREDAEKCNFIFFALTNHIRRFDTAITRKGRFDLVLPLGLPTRAGRYLWFESQIEKLKKKYLEDGFKIFDSHKEIRREIVEKKNTKGKKEKSIEEFPIDVEEVDLNILSRASDGLNFGDIESICKRVIESELRKEAEIRDFLKLSQKKRSEDPVSLRIQTDFFLEWINRLRQSGKINHEDLKKFNEDSLTYTRGSSSNTELNQIASETIKEFDSIDIKEKYERSEGNNISITIWLRNLSEFSSFDFSNATVDIEISSKTSSYELNFKRFYLIPGQSTEPIVLKLKRNGKKIFLRYSVRGKFVLQGISGTIDNATELYGEVVKTKAIKTD